MFELSKQCVSAPQKHLKRYFFFTMYAVDNSGICDIANEETAFSSRLQWSKYPCFIQMVGFNTTNKKCSSKYIVASILKKQYVPK